MADRNYAGLPTEDFITVLKDKNVKVWAENGNLKYKAPAEAMDKDILLYMKEIKQELMAYLQENDTGSLFTDPLGKAEQMEYYPLSSTQGRMFFLHKLDPENTAYNITQVLKIVGNMDFFRLYDAFKQIVQRHEIMRTAFGVEGGKPVQRVLPEVSFSVTYTEMPEEKFDLQEEVRKFIRPFDLEKPPLFRFGVVKSENREGKSAYYLMQDVHHMISDGVSEGILVDEFNRLFMGRSLPALQHQYKDYCMWEKKVLESRYVKKQKDFWIEHLKNELPVLNMPTDFKRPARFNMKGSSVSASVSSETCMRLEQLAQKLGVTLYTVLLSAYYILLHKYTGQNDIIIGIVTAGRKHADLYHLLGPFISTLPLRSYPDADKSIEEYLKEVGKSVLDVFENQEYPLDLLIQDLHLERDAGRNPLFDVMFVHQNMQVDDVKVNEYEISKCSINKEFAQCDITLTTENTKDGLSVEISYCTALFSTETIRRFAEHYTKVLCFIAEHPEDRLSSVRFLSGQETRQLIFDFNDTGFDYDRETSLHILFENQAEKNKDSVALLFDNKEYTYDELNRRANQLARKLREYGAGPNRPAGILLERSPENIIAILAVLKSGGAYLPIDIRLPKERIAYMLEDSETNILLSQERYINDISFAGHIIDVYQSSVWEGGETDLQLPCSSGNAAYLMYTSGSTGRPKGVMVRHRNVINFIQAMEEYYHYDRLESSMSVINFSFDVSILDLFVPLLNGLKMILTSEEQRAIPGKLAQMMISTEADTIQMTPSQIQMMLEREETAKGFKKLKILLACGEPFPDHMYEKLRKYTDASILNAYGPTETTVASTVKKLVPEEEVTIGRPIGNTRVYILDAFNNIQPVGVPGELCIAGEGVSAGYWKKPELTGQKFISVPFAENETVYKTGDVARWLRKGELECLGRMDKQVKIRGYRIELGEIESCLVEYEGVREAVVIDRKMANGSIVLCAYITVEHGFERTELNGLLSKRLPAYMIPSFITAMEELPLTPNGKIDKKALPQPEVFQDSKTGKREPATETEKRLALIWKKILNVEQVFWEDSFFELGGNSILVINLQVELERIGIEADVADLMNYHVLGELAAFLDGTGILSELSVIKNDDTAPGLDENFNGTVLKGIEPFNDLFYINCFYNAAFPVAQYFGKSILPFLINDSLIFSLEESDKSLLYLEYYSIKSIEEITVGMQIACRVIDVCEDPGKEIISAISNDSPVILYIDYFYQSSRAETFHKRHGGHVILVYGFDLQNKKFLILENKQLENLTYEKREIGFDDLIEGYRGYLSISSLETMYVFSCSQRGSFEEEEQNYGKVFGQNMLLRKAEIYEGIERIPVFARSIKEWLKDEAWLRDNNEELLKRWNTIVNGKKAEVYRLEHVVGNEGTLTALLKEALNVWTQIRNQTAKMIFDGRGGQKRAENIVGLLEQAYRKEIDFYNALYKKLHNETEG